MPADPRSHSEAPVGALTARQAAVLRAVVQAYVGGAGPVGSGTLAGLLPERLSSASVRNTLAELTEAGWVTKPHASAGRVPTERGLRLYVDHLLGRPALGRYEARDLAGGIDRADPDEVVRAASRLLSERSHQLGFVVLPRTDELRLRHVGLVRLGGRRVLVLLVAADGTTQRRVVEDPDGSDPRELERIGALLSERLAGETLRDVRAHILEESRALRSELDGLRARALRLARAALAGDHEGADLVIATRLALLDQPEFRDPERLRELLAAIERRERLTALLDQVLKGEGVVVKFGGEVDEPALRECALVVAPYGGDVDVPRGVLGVIGPQRMDYGRVIPLVDALSGLVTEKLCA